MGETNILAAAMPEKTQALHAKLAAWRTAINAPMPKPNRVSSDAGAPERKKRGKGKKNAVVEAASPPL